LWSSGVTITGTDGVAGAFDAIWAGVSADAAPQKPIKPATAAAPRPNPPILPNNIYDQLRTTKICLFPALAALPKSPGQKAPKTLWAKPACCTDKDICSLPLIRMPTSRIGAIQSLQPRYR
jgi:hypothetical protein